MSTDPNHPTTERIRKAADEVRRLLLAERTPGGWWMGELSTSALSTATTVSAFSLLLGERARRPGACAGSAGGRSDAELRGLRDRGAAWLIRHVNEDGGWGDTVDSFSNISTTFLCRAALRLAGADAGPGNEAGVEVARRAGEWIARAGGVAAVKARYGKDRTFSVPILTNLALAGMADWREVEQLPFELACLPDSWFAALRLPVVSYALPALIAIGLVRHVSAPTWFLPWRKLRDAATAPALRKLASIQPESGGFLEAAPLTGFVLMSLVAAGHADGPVAVRAVEFLAGSVRGDGSWPIDSNLAVWVTTLAVNGLAAGGPRMANGERQMGNKRASGGSGQHLPTPSLALGAGELKGVVGPSAPAFPHSPSATHHSPEPHSRPTGGEDRERLREWLLARQYRTVHPYTNAAPGGFAWTHLTGGVPDADDTPGAVLALLHLPEGAGTMPAVRRAADWLLDLQNDDGGWPTFCKGWTNLPFDRSGPDLTAHAMRALHAAAGRMAGQGNPPHPAGFAVHPLLPAAGEGQTDDVRRCRRIATALWRGRAYLLASRRPDGGWDPLWFGCRHAPDEGNPVYGTSRVLAALRDLGLHGSAAGAKARRLLLSVQNPDGGWGGWAGCPSTVEETSLAMDGLLPATGDGFADAGERAALVRGAEWLASRVEAGTIARADPIGLYFAKLWYSERLYPLVYACAALGQAARVLPPA